MKVRQHVASVEDPLERRADEQHRRPCERFRRAAFSQNSGPSGHGWTGESDCKTFDRERRARESIAVMGGSSPAIGVELLDEMVEHGADTGCVAQILMGDDPGVECVDRSVGKNRHQLAVHASDRALYHPDT